MCVPPPCLRNSPFMPSPKKTSIWVLGLFVLSASASPALPEVGQESAGVHSCHLNLAATLEATPNTRLRLSPFHDCRMSPLCPKLWALILWIHLVSPTLYQVLCVYRLPWAAARHPIWWVLGSMFTEYGSVVWRQCFFRGAFDSVQRGFLLVTLGAITGI